jgi:hypothetical protein
MLSLPLELISCIVNDMLSLRDKMHVKGVCKFLREVCEIKRVVLPDDYFVARRERVAALCDSLEELDVRVWEDFSFDVVEQFEQCSLLRRLRLVDLFHCNSLVAWGRCVLNVLPRFALLEKLDLRGSVVEADFDTVLNNPSVLLPNLTTLMIGFRMEEDARAMDAVFWAAWAREEKLHLSQLVRFLPRLRRLHCFRPVLVMDALPHDRPLKSLTLSRRKRKKDKRQNCFDL